MAKRKFDFDDGHATPAAPATPQPGATPAPVPVRAGGVRQPGLRLKPKLVELPAVTAVLETRDHTVLATFYVNGRVEDADHVPIMQFRPNNDIEDASNRVLARFLETEIRDHTNRPMAYYADGRLERPSHEVLGYLADGRIENEAHGIVGYYQVQIPLPGNRTLEAHLAAYLLLFQPNCWVEDQP